MSRAADSTLPTIGQLLDQTAADLDTDSARLDAEVLLAFVLDKPRSYFRAWPEKHITKDEYERFLQLLERRKQGEPLAHLTGRREFWSLTLHVTPDTLIPRPETETLVECALERIPLDKSLLIADLGTGSGVIALAIARERPHCHVIATDRSSAALQVARQNAQQLQIHNIGFLQGDWCIPLQQEKFDLIVCNPPYIAENDPHLLESDVRFEPASALISGPDGLNDLKTLIPCAWQHLTENGWLLVEHGYDQQPQTLRIFEDAGFSHITDYVDASGLSRVVAGQHKP
jgi:release factor glutamine methyltransferase